MKLIKRYSSFLMPCFYCMGSSAPPPPPPPPPPPQLPKTPTAAAVRADTIKQNIGQGGGQPQSTLLTGGLGDPLSDKLGKKTLLGSLNQ
jgi:hypothetical protein